MTKIIWSNPPHVIMEGSDLEEVLDEMCTSLMQKYERIINTMDRFESRWIGY